MKSLYKSDAHILQQLGLASSSGDLSQQQMETLQYSPQTHFKPISADNNDTQEKQVGRSWA